MPPSGYPHRDAQTIASFLLSCAQALVAENARDGRSPVSGLKREIAGIDSVLEKHADEPFALQTLLLTRAFYARLVVDAPRTNVDLLHAVPEVLNEVMAQITGVHVDHYAVSVP